MRNYFTLFFAVLLTSTLSAQSPEQMSYQAVIRDANNNLVADTQVGMKISILHGSISGTPVYVEIHTPITNTNGLVSIEIGSGIIEIGVFSEIDWTTGPFFIKTETAIETPLTTYTITGTSQLLSVPYAFHAKTAESVENIIVDYSDVTNTPDFSNYDQNATDDFDGDYNNLSNIPDLSGYLTSEVDGSVTNEIQDLQLVGNILTITNNGTATEIDLSAYLDNTDTQLSDSDIATMGYIKNENEIDPVFSEWDKSTGISITESQISDLGDYIETETDPTVPTYAIGDYKFGGVIFWLDETGKHGLVCAIEDQSDGVQWYAGTYQYTMAKGNFPMSGKLNTAIIIASQGYGNGYTYAARVCNEFLTLSGSKTYGDWYLPSSQTMHLMFLNKDVINATAIAHGGEAFSNQEYWCSNENSDNSAYLYSFHYATSSVDSKSGEHRVRAVRDF
ncbi:MAG: DUF1566 domain-containing protein [Bacteroidales bacterium]|nr:DUF1566 domain-containing protein [Bacteroidales bacterium]